MTVTLILVRHGEVDESRAGELLGRTDPPLSDAGRRQAAAVAGALGDLAGARLLCSPLLRARETAEIVAAGRPLEVDEDLQEMDFGRWEGLTYAEVERADPAGAAAWSDFAPDFAFPGGESLADFEARMGRVARSLAGGEAAKTVCVAHGGVIRALICRFLGLPTRDYLLFEVPRGSVVTIRLWGERGVLTGLWRPVDWAEGMEQ